MFVLSITVVCVYMIDEVLMKKTLVLSHVIAGGQSILRMPLVRSLMPAAGLFGRQTARIGGRLWYSVHAGKELKVNTIHDINEKYTKGIPLTMCTAYDYTTAKWVHDSNCDMLLVGDSLAMTSLGYESTTDLPFDEFKYHIKSVCRARGPAMIVADMPFGSFESSVEQGISNAVEMMKLSSRVASLKFEVGLHTKDEYTLNLVKEICSRGIPVIGHIGLTPQRVHSLGGYKVQGNKTTNEMIELRETAMKLQEAGCWCILLECVPHKFAQYLTTQLSVPTIGIGAGNGTSGQVLVVSDLLGMQGSNVPRLVKQFTNLNHEAVEAMKKYNLEVQDRKFPNEGEHTFKIKDGLWKNFIEEIENQSRH